MNHYYDRSNLQRIPELMRLAPQAAASFFVLRKGRLSFYRCHTFKDERTHCCGRCSRDGLSLLH